MTKQVKKRRRAKGSGTVYKQGRIWWIGYEAPDGTRVSESSYSTRKSDAERLLQRRIGARENGLPVIPRVEQYTFDEAAQAVLKDFSNNGKRSIRVVQRRIDKHLRPVFGAKKLIAITPEEIRDYTTKRKADTYVVRKARVTKHKDGTEQTTPEVRKPVSNAEINRELQILKRIFSLAVKDGKLARRPHIEMQPEDNARTGFFERDQYLAVLAHLTVVIRAVIRFGYITGWRIASEVLKLEWRQVDFDAGEVRLDPGTTKNREGRVFPMTAELRALLKEQEAERDRVKKAGHVVPWVFFRMVAKGRGGPLRPKPIRTFTKVWKAACVAACCPGRIPHDLRRTAVRNLVRAGVPERVAMTMTGHKTRSVFERYNIVSGGDLHDAVRKLDAAAAAPQARNA